MPSSQILADPPGFARKAPAFALSTARAAPLIDGSCRFTFAPTGALRLAAPSYVASTGITGEDASSYPALINPVTSNSRLSSRPAPIALVTSDGITYE